ncbi:hypothetical protein MTR67_050494 [Solanum verrucosum]|uniref:Late blight resistance protein n=1 Tax=Solanum verrucosum TaxID=315347 RepID=A0AAF1A1Y7_SOLVR|nr:hypothetical protein MTR67_050494 [Solanum verrucosum]
MSSKGKSQDEGSLRDQQWFWSAGHIQGVDSGCDKLGIRAQSSSILRCLRSRVKKSQDEGSLRDQQWFWSAGHIQGVDSGCDKLGIRAQSSSILRCLRSRVK